MSTEFFRKYADLITEAESSNIAPKDDIPAVKPTPDIQEPEIKIDQLELMPPVDAFKYPKSKLPSTEDDPNSDIASMTDEEKLAEIERIEKQLKYITPVDTIVDAGNGDKIIKNISPRDLEKMNQGVPSDPNMRRMPWNPNQDSEATRQDIESGAGSLPPKPSGMSA